MLTRLLALLLALGLGGAAFLVATTRSTLDATTESATAEHDAALLSAGEEHFRSYMEQEAERAAAFDFSAPLGGKLATMVDADENEANKAAARAAVPAALTEAARGSGADLLLVTDAAGTVLARAEDPTVAGDNVAGYPPVRDALAGAITDDVWVLSGKVYHVLGVPVLDLGTVVGAVLWARMIRGDDLVSATAGLDVGAALFHLPEEGPAVVHAATKPAGDAKTVVALLTSAATELATMRKEKKTHGPGAAELGGKSVTALFVPLPGQAGEAHGAGLLLVTDAAPAVGEGSIDLTDSTVLGLFGAAVLGLLLALVLPSLDGRSVRRAIAEAEAAADIRATRRATLPPPGPPDPRDVPQPGPLSARLMTPSGVTAPSANAAAGIPTMQGMPGMARQSTQPPVPGPILATSEPHSSLRSTVVDQPAFMRGASAEPVTSPGKPSPLPPPLARPPLPTVSPDDAPPAKPGAHRPTLPYPAPPAAADAPDPFAAKTMTYDQVVARESAGVAPPQPEPEEMLGDRTVVSSVSEVLARAEAEGPPPIRKGGSAGGGRPADDLKLGAPPPPPPGAHSTAAEDREEEAHYREVYQQFMATKQRCGEPMDLTYDRFLERLHATKKSLIERYQCRTVRFSPYVKAGKAALKATPVK
jgi:hypothetical protein